MNNKKGFTLIELLVVVAIIGVLATIVLASLGSARIRAKDAAVVSAMSSYRTEIEIVFSDGNYASLCSSQVISDLTSDVEKQGGEFLGCDFDNQGYVVVATLPSASLATLGGTNVAYAANEPYVCIDGNGSLKKFNDSDFFLYDGSRLISCENLVYTNTNPSPAY